MENKIKWLVTDAGMQMIKPDHELYDDKELPIFENRDDAMVYMLVCLADRLTELEKKNGSKS